MLLCVTVALRDADGNADYIRCTRFHHAIHILVLATPRVEALRHEGLVAVDTRYIVEMQRIYSSYFRSWRNANRPNRRMRVLYVLHESDAYAASSGDTMDRRWVL